MWLQLLLIFVALFLYLILIGKGDNKFTRHRYVTFLCIILIIQSGFRHLAVGDDTYAYSLFFDDLKFKSWRQIFANFYDVYVLKQGKDAGYILLEKVFQILFPSFRLFLIAIAFCFFVPFMRMIERYLPSLGMIFMSFCIYQSLFYSFFSITGIRQVIATIATIIGVRLIQEQKLKKFIIIILLASFIHKSVLIFLPFYFIANFQKSKLLLISALCSLPVIFPFARIFAHILADISGSNDYLMYAESEYQTSGATNFSVLLVFASVCLLIAKSRNPNKIPNLIINATSLAIVFLPLTWVDPSLMRVVQYFSVFLVIALPLAIANLNLSRDILKLLYIGVVFILLYTIIRRSYEYAFFWQDMQLPIQYL